MVLFNSYVSFPDSTSGKDPVSAKNRTAIIIRYGLVNLMYFENHIRNTRRREAQP